METNPTSLVAVDSTLSALQSLAMAVSSGKPVIVAGHVGAGKTSIVEHLATLAGRQSGLIKVKSPVEVISYTQYVALVLTVIDILMWNV